MHKEAPLTAAFPVSSRLCADLLLLNDEEPLKCFTRTQYDFTCFFETSDNTTYDLRYSISRSVRPVCAPRFGYDPEKGVGSLKPCFSSVVSQSQKVRAVHTEDRRGLSAPRLLISCCGRPLVCGNAP